MIISRVSHRSSTRGSGQEEESPLPPVHERLAYLRPSRELLEFYRQKIAQYDGENEDLLRMLEKQRSIIDDQVGGAGTVIYRNSSSSLTTGVISSSSINCSGSYVSVKERSRSCRTLWVTCRSTSSKRGSSRCGCTQRTIGWRSGRTGQQLIEEVEAPPPWAEGQVNGCMKKKSIF